MANINTTEDDEYHRDSSEAKSYMGVYGLTTPREKVYGYDEHGQRREVAPIREVAGLELLEYKFQRLQEMMDANSAAINKTAETLETIQGALTAIITSLKTVTDISVTNFNKNYIEPLTDERGVIGTQGTTLAAALEKYKKEHIDIKDYPSYL